MRFIGWLFLILLFIPLAQSAETLRMRHYLEEHYLDAWGNGGSSFSPSNNSPEPFHKQLFSWEFSADASQSPPKLYRKKRWQTGASMEEWGTLPEAENYSQPLSAHGKLWILALHEGKWTLHSSPLAQEQAVWSPHSAAIRGDIKAFAADRNNDPILIADSSGYSKITGKFTGGGGGIAWGESEKISETEFRAFKKENAALSRKEEIYGEFDLHRQGAMLALAWKTANDGGAKIRYRVSKGSGEPYGAWRTPTGVHSAKLDATAQFLQYHLTAALSNENGKRTWPDIQLTYRFEDSGEGHPLPPSLDARRSSPTSANNSDSPHDNRFPSAKEQEKPSMPDKSETSAPGGDSQENPKRDKADNPEKTSSDEPPSAPEKNNPQKKDRNDPNLINTNDSQKAKPDKPANNTPQNQPQRSIQSPSEPDGDPNGGGENAPTPPSSPNTPEMKNSPAANPPPAQKASSSPGKKAAPNSQEKDNPSKAGDGDKSGDGSSSQSDSPPSSPNPTGDGSQGGSSSGGNGGSGSAGSANHPSFTPNSPPQSHPDSMPSSPNATVNFLTRRNIGEKKQADPAISNNRSADAGKQDEESAGTKQSDANSIADRNHSGAKDLGGSSGDAPVEPATEEDGFYPGHQSGGDAAAAHGESQESQGAPSTELPRSTSLWQPFSRPASGGAPTAWGGSGGAAGRAIAHATGAASLEPIRNLERKTYPSPLDKNLPAWLGFFLFFWLWRRKKQEDSNSNPNQRPVDSSIAKSAPDMAKWSSFLQEDNAPGLGWDRICSFDPSIIAVSVAGDRAALMKDDGQLWTGSSRFLIDGCDWTDEDAVLTPLGNLDRNAANASLALGEKELYVAAEDERGRSLAKVLSLASNENEHLRKFKPPRELKSPQRLWLAGKRLLAAGFSANKAKLFEASIGAGKIGRWQEMRPEGLKGGSIITVSSGSDTLIAGTPVDDPHTLWLYEKTAKGWRPLATIAYHGEEILLYSEPKRCFMMDRMEGDKTFRFQAFSRDEKGQFTGKRVSAVALPGDFSLSSMNISGGRLFITGRENASPHSRLILLSGRLREFLKMNVQAAA